MRENGRSEAKIFLTSPRRPRVRLPCIYLLFSLFFVLVLKKMLCKQFLRLRKGMQ
jgi:hypothetical protein